MIPSVVYMVVQLVNSQSILLRNVHRGPADKLQTTIENKMAGVLWKFSLAEAHWVVYRKLFHRKLHTWICIFG